MKLIARKTGIGNQVLFAQSIIDHKNLTTDSLVYGQLGIDIPFNPRREKINIILYGYDWKKFWLEKLKNPFGKFYGFQYRILGNYYSLGYTKAIRFDNTLHESENNKKLWSLL